MKKSFLALYIVCTLASIAMFILCNILTEPLQTESELGGGGNGNPGLFPIIFFLPFFLFFLYGTTEILMRWIHKKYSLRIIILFTLLSMFGVVTIASLTLIEANEFRSFIVEVNPSFEDESQVTLLNTFSNSIFFNQYTFLMLIFACLFLGGVWALLKKRTEVRK